MQNFIFISIQPKFTNTVLFYLTMCLISPTSHSALSTYTCPYPAHQTHQSCSHSRLLYLLVSLFRMIFSISSNDSLTSFQSTLNRSLLNPSAKAAVPHIPLVNFYHITIILLHSTHYYLSLSYKLIN